MSPAEFLAFEFIRNALAAAVLASLLCGLVGTFVVVKRLVFLSGGVSHAAFGGLGLFYYLGLNPLLGAAVAATATAIAVVPDERSVRRSRDAMIGILWAVGMAVGVIFISRTPGYAPDLTSYLFGDILLVDKPLLAALAIFVLVAAVIVGSLFKELQAVAFDEEYARAQGLPVRRFLLLLMLLIALSVVLLIQVVGVMLAIALLTIPPLVSLDSAQTLKSAIFRSTLIGMVMTLGGLWLSFAWDFPSGPTIVLLGFVILLVSRLRHRRGLRSAGIATLAALAVIPLWATTEATPLRADNQPTVTDFRHLEFLGEAEVPRDPVGGVPLGGLSGITFDAQRNRYYVVSDDRAEMGPARFYTLEIDLTEGSLRPGGIRVVGMTALTTAEGHRFAAQAIDPEAIALTSEGTLIVASEGDARVELPPFLREFGLDGRQRRDFPLGQRYMPTAHGQSGVRYNLALESAALTPDQRFLYSATENALSQDGPVSDLQSMSPGRILKYDLQAGALIAEHLYWIDRVSEAPEPAEAFSVNGVVDVLAVEEDLLLVVERSFSVGRGNDVRIYEVDLREADDILPIAELRKHGTETVQPARKRLLMHINRTGIVPDNLEGVTFGPRLDDGRPTLLLISDDNFNPRGQVNQVLAFALGSEAARIHDLQGAAHRSPFEMDWVRGVRGIVTAVDHRSRSTGFWMQTTDSERDGDPATSEGIFVARRAPDVVAGELVEVDGAVVEEGFKGALTVTTLRAAEVRVQEDSGMAPAPLEIGRQRGLMPPTVVDDDRLQSFDPCCDAIDFFESLEGMQVRVTTATTVGGTTRFNEIAVVTGEPETSGARTLRGGVLLRAGDPNPHRLLVDDRLTGEAPEVDVGQRLQGPLVGVIDYGFSNYRLQPTTVPRFTPSVAIRETARPERPGEISVATYNVLNLDAVDEPQKFERLARSIVEGLGAPSILGLQEVQDDNGADDNGVVSALQTLTRLVEAIERAGGPTYEFRQIDPERNADGGQPNGNIRVVWLFDPARVDVPDRGTPSAGARAEVERTADGRPYLTTNPARLAPRSSAFAGDPARGWAGGRKCLALEARVAGDPLFLINCHLKSKRGDDRWFGPTQPPIFHTEEQRSEQVRGILEFVRSIQLADPQARVIVLGDMNEHEFRPPMRLLSGTELINITERVPLESRYSYNFNGNSQLLDHILVGPALEQSVTEIDILHLNADLADRSRASDHDPVLVRLALGED